MSDYFYEGDDKDDESDVDPCEKCGCPRHEHEDSRGTCGCGRCKRFKAVGT